MTIDTAKRLLSSYGEPIDGLRLERPDRERIGHFLDDLWNGTFQACDALVGGVVAGEAAQLACDAVTAAMVERSALSAIVPAHPQFATGPIGRQVPPCRQCGAIGDCGCN